MAGRGFGGNYGYNYGGGGIPYLSSLVPAPNALIPIDGYVRLTVGVQGGMINLSTVHITVASELAFDGSTLSFGPDFLGSDYVFVPADNGYRFNILKSSPYDDQFATVIVEAETNDGTPTVQSYQVSTGAVIAYPPVPFGTELNRVPIRRFSGEVDTGLLSGAQGLAFVSPALKFQSIGSQMDVDVVEVATQAGDRYRQSPGDNLRPFLWGPPLLVPPVPVPVFPPQFDAVNYKPVWNGASFGFLKTTGRSVLGVMHDTILLTDTVILY
jgi:hypothetical protein